MAHSLSLNQDTQSQLSASLISVNSDTNNAEQIELTGRLGNYVFKVVPLQETETPSSNLGYLAALIPLLFGIMIGCPLIKAGSLDYVVGGICTIVAGAAISAYCIYRVKKSAENDEAETEKLNQNIREAAARGNPLLSVTQSDGESVLPEDCIHVAQNEMNADLQKYIQDFEREKPATP